MENRRISENYQALEAWTSDAAARYHEVNHQLTALDCLYRNGNYQEMAKYFTYTIKCNLFTRKENSCKCLCLTRISV